MSTSRSRVLTSTFVFTMAAVVSTHAASNAQPPSASLAANPFAAPSTLPYHLPDFAHIKDADFVPALEQGMATQRREVHAIAHNPEPPGFENTIVALERSGALLERTLRVFSNFTSMKSDPELDKAQQDMAPKLAAHQDAIDLDPVLFARIDTLYQRRASLKLDPESEQLLERYYKIFVHAGARLSAADRATLKHYNATSATLTTKFQQTVLKAAKDGAVVVDNVADLDGLSREQIGAAAAAARARGLSGKWLIALQNTTIQPVLANLKNRALRERIFRASVARGNGGADDNTATIAKLVSLRAKRAQLLGFPSHAVYVLEEEDAGTPKAVNEILAQIAQPALTAARREAADIQQLIDAQAQANRSMPFELQPWDWAFYAEQVRKAHFDFDEAQVKPYFELDRVLKNGVFYAAHELYGVTFTERTDLPVYDSAVRTFEVRDADGSPLGLFLIDYFARDNKQGGAWENAYVSESKLFGLHAVVANQLNIPRPDAGQPVLLTFDEVTTMFHEFGHALHDIFSIAQYPTLSGTNVPPDFGEYPSQFNEMWAREPAVLAHFARHYQTDEPMPRALLDKVLAATKYGQGYATIEYLAAAMLDQSWHQIGAAQAPGADQVMAFEAHALVQDGIDYAPVPPRYHSAYFSHIFAGDDYAAGYYAYLWSEVLARDTGQWFRSHGGLTRANGDVFRSKVLSRGRTQEPAVLFGEFYGKPDIGPLLDYRGLSSP
jgi:peptidyl-dipeptidase Dcp